MSLKGTAYEGLQPLVEKAVLKYCSGRDSIMSCAYKCILNKYEKRKMTDKLSAHLDSSKASKLASKLDDILYEFEEKLEKKRKHEETSTESPAKRAKFQEGTKENVIKTSSTAPETPIDGDSASPPSEAPTAPLSSQQIKDMMVNAQKLIMERKKLLEGQLGIAPAATAPGPEPGVPAPFTSSIPPPGLMPGMPFMQRPPRPMGPGFGGGHGPGHGHHHHQNRFVYVPRRQANANFRMQAAATLMQGPVSVPTSNGGPILVPPPTVVIPQLSSAPKTEAGAGAGAAAIKQETQGDRAQRIMDLQEEIKSKLGAAGIPVTTTADRIAGKKIPPLMPQMAEEFLQSRKRSQFDVPVSKMETPRAPTAPQPGMLKLVDGRMVDASGNEITISHPEPELKANLRAKKTREMKKEGVETGIQSVIKSETPLPTGARSESGAESTAPFFDPRVNMKSAVRTSRRFMFNDPGKFVKIGTQMRMKAQLEKVQNEINQLAKKTGISSVTKLALATSSIQKVDKLAGLDDVPDVEWWDVIVLKGKEYGETDEEIAANVNEIRITNLIEHPTHVVNPGNTEEDTVLPVFLTKQEQKKKRRQNRRETWKEKQEKIRLGLEPAPEPRMTISNLMRVLGTDAVQDPTKVEAHVREQMAKRQRLHQETNEKRKLTKEQKREKKLKKIKEDVSNGVRVAVYRVRSLANPSKKFKVETNCKQYHMTGCVVLHKETNVIVVEGGPKQQKKFKRLMLTRIKWNEDRLTKPGESSKSRDSSSSAMGDDDDGVGGGKDGSSAANDADLNKCVLVWEGMTKERNFGEILFKFCPTESFARDFFKKRGVEHYWDLAYSGAILEAAEEN